MSIEQVDKVDFIGTDNKSGAVVLTISDHLPWEGSSCDHLLLLQTKINTYIRFVESGELLETYPRAKGKKILIKVICQYRPSTEAEKFFTRASNALEGTALDLSFEVFRTDA